jgi:hypothetical protein
MSQKAGVSQSKLAQRYGNRLRQAHEAHKNDEMKINEFSTLPPGIDDGVAVLEKCLFREIPQGRKENVGEYEFYAVGVMIEPKEHAGKKVQGVQIYYQEPLADTPNTMSKKKTFEDHYASILNEMRKLGCDTNNISIDELEARAAQITSQQPYFKIRTSLLPAIEGQEPRVYVLWNGPVDDDWTPPDLSASGDTDNTGKKATANGQARTPTAVVAAKPATVPPPVTAPPVQEPHANVDMGDMDSLLKLAVDKDGNEEGIAAQDQLREMATNAGMPQVALNSEDTTWEDVVNFIRAGGQQVAAPAKGEVWKTQLADPKTKRPSNKLTRVEIVLVDQAKQVVDVRDLVTKKVIKAIPFTGLVADE